MLAGKFLTRKQYNRRLLKLADLLDNLPRKRFNFGSYGRVDDAAGEVNILSRPEACGTTACALGWAPSLPFAKKQKIQLRSKRNKSYVPEYGEPAFYVDFLIRGRQIDPMMVSLELFGLSSDQHCDLFIPGISINGFPENKPREKATPKQVARHIRKYVRTRLGGV
jgi:hypothetical protein